MEKFRVGHTPKLQTNLIMRKGRNDELLLAIGKGGEGGPPVGPKSWNSLLQGLNSQQPLLGLS